jgi:hypothetical protein
MIKQLTIGSKIFVVHKDYAGKKKPGGVVNLARIVCFRNRNEKVEPEFRLIGQSSQSSNCTTEMYTVFLDIKKAIKAIESK